MCIKVFNSERNTNLDVAKNEETLLLVNFIYHWKSQEVNVECVKANQFSGYNEIEYNEML